MEMSIWFGLIAFCGLSAAPLPPQEASAGKETVFIVPHTHWEGAVFKTREEYLDIGLPHILKALHLLKKYPEYRFVLDQMCYVKPFLERYPAEAPLFRKFLDEGRLQIAGGTDTMHDNNMPSGESIVRQYLLGKWFFRDRLGYDVKTGWGLDTFGHNAQMPQILKLAAMRSYWFQRGAPGRDTPAEFFWQGIDGSQMPAFWLPIGYGPFHNVPANAADFDRFARARVTELAPFTTGAVRLLMAGADVWEPEDHLPGMIEQFNRSTSSAPFILKFGLPQEYEETVARRPARPVISRELNPVFQGIYSSRIELKQTMRDLERVLVSAEKASVLASLLGVPADRAMLDRAWEPVLFNQAHDLASGVMVDKVYDDTLLGYAFSRRLGEELLSSRLQAVMDTIDTQGDGVPIVIFNKLGWPRSDYAEADIGFTDPDVQDLRLLDPSGKPAPFQIVNEERNGDGSLRLATVGFLASDIPAMGYAVYRVVPATSFEPATAGKALSQRAARQNTSYEDTGYLENDFYRAAFNLWTGEMKSLVLKENNWEVLGGPANVVSREQDGGDFWELYGTLNGGRFTAMTKEVPAPDPRRSVFSNEYVGGTGRTSTAPVFSEFSISHPFGKNHFATSVRMYAGLRRIDIRTEILNNEELVRYRVLFPTSVRSGSNTHAIPFGAIDRPEKREWPAQEWIDYNDGARGLAILNRGLPGSNVSEGTLMVSLMRSARLIAYGYIGGYEPGVSSDTGLQLGKRLTFHYALVPHAGDWRTARVDKAGIEFNNPLIARTTRSHAGLLPKRWSLLSVSNDQAVLTALKPGRNGDVVLRVYEATGRAAKGVRIRLERALTAAKETNLIEDPVADVPVHENGFAFDLRPFEIKTFQLRLP
jgi:alpha-mannosidase